MRMCEIGVNRLGLWYWNSPQPCLCTGAAFCQALHKQNGVPDPSAQKPLRAGLENVPESKSVCKEEPLALLR